MPTRRSILGIASAAALVVMAAVAAVPAFAQERLRVVATTGMIADAARSVGGERVAVEALMGPGVDPHAYRQTRSGIVAMANADLVLYHGLYLEAQLADFLRELGAERNVVAVAEGLPRERLIAHDDYADRFDPHVWMDPALWAQVVKAVRDALIATDPDHADSYRANADRYDRELKAVARYARDVLGTVPDGNRVLVTSHDAFNYFGAAYGFEVVGIQGISTESEAGLNRIGALVDRLVHEAIGAVFVETSVSDRNMRALIEGARARGHTVGIGGELYSDAMGEPGTYEGTYIGMIDHNATTITRALGGNAPAAGMAGQLAQG